MDAKNPQWANAAHTIIDMAVVHEVYGSIPFSASPIDTEPHGRELFQRAVDGAFGAIADYAEPVKTPAEIAAARKAEILAALSALDAKSIRPLREGDAARVDALEAEAMVLRAELAAL